MSGGAALFSACLNALAIVASWWTDANLTPHLVLTGRVGQLVRSRGRLIGRQTSIRVDPFSPLHHQWVAWMLSG